MRDHRRNGHGTRGPAALEQAFRTANEEGRAALVTYLTAGYPAPSDTLGLVMALQSGGADVIELGVPHSDPVADGPTIQRAAHLALQQGTTPGGCLEMVRSLRAAGLTVPLVLMGYYNPIHRRGLATYVHEANEAGAAGLIVPDLPLEEAPPLQAACAAEGLALVQLVAPTSPEERVARLARETEGFLYVVSRLGTTGMAQGPAADLADRLATIRRHARTPVAVGFGVSAPEAVRQVAALADGVVVGSAIVERAAEGPKALEGYVANLCSFLTRA